MARQPERLRRILLRRDDAGVKGIVSSTAAKENFRASERGSVPLCGAGNFCPRRQKENFAPPGASDFSDERKVTKSSFKGCALENPPSSDCRRPADLFGAAVTIPSSPPTAGAAWCLSGACSPYRRAPRRGLFERFPHLFYRGARHRGVERYVDHRGSDSGAGAGRIVRIAPSKATLACGRTKAGTWGGSPKRRFAHFAAEGKVCRAGARNIPRSGGRETSPAAEGAKRPF